MASRSPAGPVPSNRRVKVAESDKESARFPTFQETDPMSAAEHTPHELHTYDPPAEMKAHAWVAGMDAYNALCAEAEADHEAFWARQARELLSWKTPFTKTLDESQAPFYKWFEDGTLNASYNCLDRNVAAGLGDKVAIVFEADDGSV